MKEKFNPAKFFKGRCRWYSKHSSIEETKWGSSNLALWKKWDIQLKVDTKWLKILNFPIHLNALTVGAATGALFGSLPSLQKSKSSAKN